MGAVRLVSAAKDYGWLESSDLAGGGSTSGYDVLGWDACVWILNPYYTLPPGYDLSGGPPSRSYVDMRRPAPWQPIRWAELAKREGLEFPASWHPGGLPLGPLEPGTIYPDEGCFDLDVAERLLAHLRSVETESTGVFRGLVNETFWASFDQPVVFEGELEDLLIPNAPPAGELEGVLIRGPEDVASLYPISNVWPLDKSWFIYLDYWRLCAKVSGSADLISAITEDRGLETVDEGQISSHELAVHHP